MKQLAGVSPLELPTVLARVSFCSFLSLIRKNRIFGAILGYAQVDVEHIQRSCIIYRLGELFAVRSVMMIAKLKPIPEIKSLQKISTDE
jgi:hypothetical protein